MVRMVWSQGRRVGIVCVNVLVFVLLKILSGGW